MAMICPYCETEINEKLVEAEDGCCPECGAVLTAGTVITEEEDNTYGNDDEFGEEYDEDDELDKDYDDGYEDEYGEDVLNDDRDLFR